MGGVTIAGLAADRTQRLLGPWLGRLRASLAAYSDDEARDKDGKWTTGGLFEQFPPTVLHGELKGTSADPRGRVGSFDPDKGGLLFHGTGESYFKPKPGELYTALDWDETEAWAKGEIPGAGSGDKPKTMVVEAKPGKTLDVTNTVDGALENDEDDFEKKIFREARTQGARYVVFDHPSSVRGEDRDSFKVVVALYPNKDLKSTGGWSWSTLKSSKDLASAVSEAVHAAVRSASGIISKIHDLPNGQAPTGKWQTLRKTKERRYGKGDWKKTPLKLIVKPSDAIAFNDLPSRLRSKLVREAPVKLFDPRSLATNQAVVHEGDLVHFVHHGKEADPVIILKTKVGLYVHNGNHRSAIALLSGHKVKGRHIDLSQVKQIKAYSDDEARDKDGKWTTMYHGTNEHNLDSIMKEGIKPKASDTYGGRKLAFVTLDEKDARGWSTVTGKSGRGVVLQIRVPSSFANGMKKDRAYNEEGPRPGRYTPKTIPADWIQSVKRQRVSMSPDSESNWGNWEPKQIKAYEERSEENVEAYEMRDNNGVFLDEEDLDKEDVAAYSEDQPRDDHGRWTAGDTNTDRTTWHFDDYHPDEKINGVSLAHVSNPDFTKLTNPDLEEGPLKVAGWQHAAAGVVMIEPDNKVWVVTPDQYFGMYRNTFPKGTVESGESLQQAAVRETYEESGLLAKITGVLGDVNRSSSATRYYIGERVGGSPAMAGEETYAVKLMDLNDPKTEERLTDVQGHPTADKDVLQLIRDHLGIEKPPPEPGAPLTHADIMHEKVGGAQGTNAGGVYRGTDGVDRYVKLYNNPEQAHQEALANTVYRDLGVNAPNSHVFDLPNGKEAFASDIIQGGKTLEDTGLTKENAREVLKGLAADVLTANWDSVGLTYDNILMKDGEAHRIDNGAAFMYRAQGGLKPAALLNQATEIKGFFNPAMNHEYATLTKKAGYSSADEVPGIRSQVQKIVGLQQSSGGWDKYLSGKAPYLSPSESSKIAGMMTSRTKALTDYVGIHASAAAEVSQLVEEMAALDVDMMNVRCTLIASKLERGVR